MFKELFSAACSKPAPFGIPVSPQSRSMYAIDLMLDWETDDNGMNLNTFNHIGTESLPLTVLSECSLIFN